MNCPNRKTRLCRVLVASNDPVLENLLSTVLRNHPFYELLGNCRSVSELIQRALTWETDVVVFDQQLPDGSGLEALRQVCRDRPVAGVALLGPAELPSIRSSLVEFALTYALKPVDGPRVEVALEIAWARLQSIRQFESANAALRKSLQDRKVIERAKGILMQRNHWSESDAFRRLQRGAMNKRVPMMHLAEAVLSGRHVDL